MKKVQIYFYKTIFLFLGLFTSFSAISQGVFTASINGSKNICQGISTRIAISCQQGVPPYQVTYSDGKFLYPTTVLGNDLSILVSPLISTEYKLVSVVDHRNVSANIGGSTCRITVSNPTFVGVRSLDGNFICAGSGKSVTLQATGVSQYSWSPSNGIQVLNNETIKVSPQTTTIYSVIGTDNNGCIDSAKVTIQVAMPPAPIIPDHVSRCGPGNVTIKASGSTGKYNWYSDYNSTVPVSKGDSITVVLTIGSTNVFATAVDASGCESYKYQAISTVIMYPIPDEPVVTSNTICSAGTAVFTANREMDGVSVFRWYENSYKGAPLLKESSSNMDTTFSANVDYPKGYFVYAYNKYTGCKSATMRVAANVLPKPDSPANPNNPVTCTPGPIDISVDDIPGYVYTWYGSKTDGRAYVNRGGGQAYNQHVFPSYVSGDNVVNTSTAWVEMYDPVSGCVSDRIPVTATYYKIPAPIVPSVVSICQGTEKEITAMVPAGLGNHIGYRWYQSLDPAEQPISTSATINISASETGVYVYYASVIDFDKNFCESDRSLAEVTITVNETPEAPAINTLVKCGYVLYESSGTLANEKYQWFNNSGTILSVGENYRENNVDVEKVKSVAILSDNGCSSKAIQLNASAYSFPDKPEVTSVFLCNQGTANLSAFVSDAEGYRWYTDSTGLDLVAETEEGSYITTVLNTTTDYYASVINSQGCESKKSLVRIVILSPLAILSDKVRICKGDSVVLTASGGSNSYDWIADETVVRLSDSSILVKPMINSTYTLKDKSISSPCNSIQYTVEIDTSAKCFSPKQEPSKDTLKNLLVEAYPNPFENETHVNLSHGNEEGDAKVILRDMNGSEVISSKNHPLNTPFQIGSTLIPGFYTLEVEVAGKRETIRILKAK